MPDEQYIPPVPGVHHGWGRPDEQREQEERCPTCYGKPNEPLVLTRPPWACDHPTFHGKLDPEPPHYDDDADLSTLRRERDEAEKQASLLAARVEELERELDALQKLNERNCAEGARFQQAGGQAAGIALDVLKRTESAEARLERCQKERAAVIRIINLYGDRTLHEALTDAGLLSTESNQSPPSSSGDE